MVPRSVQTLPALPLTAAGKVDRAALRAMPLAAERPASPLPEDPLARTVLAIWAEVAGAVPAMQANFFRDGGDSLGAARLTMLVQERLDVRVALRHFAREPTPEALVRRVRAATAA